MILTPKQANLAYRCPKCGKMVFSVVGIFSLGGDLIKLKCECKDSELTVTYTNDKKIRITVPCVICPNPHTYVISSSVFFDGDIFRLGCTYSAVDICLIGKREKVLEAAKEADDAFVKLLTEAGISDFETFIHAKEEDDKRFEGEYADPQMQSIVHFMLCELEDEGNISCRCETHGKYEFKFVGQNLDTVLIYCEKCSASVSVHLPDAIAANAFLHIDKLTLT